MATPKSVTKIRTKQGKSYVEYTSNVKAAQYYIFELSRAALRDVAKFVKKKFKEEFYSHFGRRTGNAGKATRYKVISGKNTKYPRVQIGLTSQDADGYYAYFQEFGTTKKNAYGVLVPKLGLLQKVVRENISEIVRIESKYLNGLSGEADRLDALISEGDMEDNGED